jgi:hypothetical protein
VKTATRPNAVPLVTSVVVYVDEKTWYEKASIKYSMLSRTNFSESTMSQDDKMLTPTTA